MRAPALVLLVFFLTSLVFAQQPADVGGTWNVSLDSPNGPVVLRVVIKFEGAKMTAVIAGPNGDTPMRAKLEGKTITLAFNAPPAFNSIEITLTGTIEGNSMKGTVDYSGFSQSEWSATRESSSK
jgi:hypothetical protein